MDGRRVSDFSIERILSPQLGHRPQVLEGSPDGYVQGIPGGFSLDLGNLRPPAPVPVPLQMPGCLQCYPYGAGFHHPDFSSLCPSSGAYAHFSSRDSADVHPMPGYHGYQQAALPAHAQHRQRTGRLRTVFTDSQTKQLEALFELTDYPTVETRAEVARRTGLSEETVRVWFKNRRARRKRSDPRFKSPSRPLSSGAEKLSSSVL